MPKTWTKQDHEKLKFKEPAPEGLKESARHFDRNKESRKVKKFSRINIVAANTNQAVENAEAVSGNYAIQQGKSHEIYIEILNMFA